MSVWRHWTQPRTPVTVTQARGSLGSGAGGATPNITRVKCSIHIHYIPVSTPVSSHSTWTVAETKVGLGAKAKEGTFCEEFSKSDGSETPA